MRKGFWIAIGIGLAAAAILVSGILYMQRGARIRVTGEILKVRTAPLDDGSSIAVVDFRFRNPGDYFVVVRAVTLTVEDAAGNRVEGMTVSEVDAKRLFEALPVLGQKFNDTLVMRDRVPPGASMDRMLAARFEMPESKLESRKRLVLRVEDVDGPVSELSERK